MGNCDIQENINMEIIPIMWTQHLYCASNKFLSACSLLGMGNPHHVFAKSKKTDNQITHEIYDQKECAKRYGTLLKWTNLLVGARGSKRKLLLLKETQKVFHATTFFS